METKHESGAVDSFDRLYYGSLVFAGLCLLGAAFLVVGEVLDWWNDAGELGITVLTVLGTLIAVLAFFFGAGRGQVAGVAVGVGRVETRLTSMDGKLTSMDGKLDKLDELDVIEAQLNFQSGALERQVAILTQIRDRL